MQRYVLLASLGALASIGANAQAQVPVWGQCGGIGWAGGTVCAPGSTCTVSNPHYSQCLPGAAPSTPVTTSSAVVSTSARPTTSSPVVTSSASRTSSTGPSASPSASPAPANAEWAAAIVKAKAAVAKLTLKEKVSLGTGVGWMNGACLGNTPPIPSINFPGLCLQDSPVGVRFADKVSAFPAAINLAATFNRGYMRSRGVAMGEEFRGKGVNVALTPMMNLARAPAGGRNWEGFGASPYLSGEAAYESIIGLQSTGVQGTAKHYILNEQEHFRDKSSSNIDDRTLHELYLPPFLRSVQANVASVMCNYRLVPAGSSAYCDIVGAYNQINGSFACENDKALNGILKGEFGFQGYMMSDWAATHSTLSVNAGLDMTMPGDITFGSGTTYFGDTLVNAVNSGQISQTRINDLAVRILAAWYLLKQDTGYPAVNFDSWTPSKGTHVDVQGNHKDIIRKIGAASTVLLKNTKSALPLKAPKTIGIIGNGAGANPGGPNACVDRGCNVGVLAMGWGSGTADYPYLITPLDAITTRARLDGAVVSSTTSDTDLNAAGSVAAGKDVALVFITADSGEEYITVEGNKGDRNNLLAWHNGDALVQKVASVSANTIVVCNTVGPILMESWINNPNVTAVVWSGLPGQEAGNSLVDILYGAVNPSGRLPYTIARAEADNPARVIYNSNQAILPIPYTEGLFIDYFGFDKAKIAPRFEFGFGLSYTTFAYSGISVTGSTAGGSPPTGPGSSLDPWLHNKVITVTFTLKNSGSVAGTEIPQLYTSPPASANTAPYLLRGFDSVALDAGESKVVTFTLSRYDLSVWDVPTQTWRIPAGTIGLSVGASSRDLKLMSVVPT